MYDGGLTGFRVKNFNTFKITLLAMGVGTLFKSFTHLINSTGIPYSVMWFAFHMPCMRTELKLESPIKFHITVRQ